MKIAPSLGEAKKSLPPENLTVLPVSCEILSDFTTPIETMKILKNVSTHCFMLESAWADRKWGRYTFLGFDPKLEITCTDGQMQIGSLRFRTENPSEYLRQILADYKSPRFDYLPPLQEVSQAISLTNTWDTENRLSAAARKIRRISKMWI